MVKWMRLSFRCPLSETRTAQILRTLAFRPVPQTFYYGQESSEQWEQVVFNPKERKKQVER